MKRTVTLLLILILLLGLCMPAGAASDAGEKALDLVIRAIRNWEPEVDLSSLDLTSDEAMEVLSALHREPELFYFKNYTVWSSGKTGKVTKVDLEYRPEFTRADVTTFEEAVQDALSCVLPGMTDVQMALVLHDYLDLRVAYDIEAYRSGNISAASYTAYGALVLGKAVCQGYSMAYRVLLERCGVPTAYVSSDGMNHGWTQVQLGGKWYHVDVTWDDPTPDLPGRAMHGNFLVSDTVIRDDDHRHYGWEAENLCTDTTYDEGMLWQDQVQPLWFTDADTCWQLQVTGKGREQRIDLVQRSWSTGQKQITYTMQDYWKVWGSGSSYWTEAYSGLALWDERLFFNDTQHIYAYDPADGTCETVFAYSGDEGYIYGLSPAGEEGILWVLKTDPNREGSVQLFTPERKHAHAPAPVIPFSDVRAGDYFAEAVLWAVENGVTNGLGDGLFGSDRTVIRRDAVTFLWRAMGQPEPRGTVSGFIDVEAGSYYEKAVIWAVENGITDGVGGGRFDPTGTLTRAQMITFLWRTMDRPGGVTPDAEWYADAENWAEGCALTDGTGQAYVRTEDCPRRDVVTYLWRALEQAG